MCQGSTSSARVPTLICLPRVQQATDRLGDTGRVLLRPSGTEPLVRVMVEAPTQQLADEVGQELAAAVRRR